MDPSATVAQAPVITVIIDSAHADGPRALFELVEAATRTDSKRLPRNNVGLPLPAISQVTAVNDQFSTHTQAGHPLSADRLDEILDVARGRASLSRATCHELRHTCLPDCAGRHGRRGDPVEDVHLRLPLRSEVAFQPASTAVQNALIGLRTSSASTLWSSSAMSANWASESLSAGGSPRISRAITQSRTTRRNVGKSMSAGSLPCAYADRAAYAARTVAATASRSRLSVPARTAARWTTLRVSSVLSRPWFGVHAVEEHVDPPSRLDVILCPQAYHGVLVQAHGKYRLPKGVRWPRVKIQDKAAVRLARRVDPAQHCQSAVQLEVERALRDMLRGGRHSHQAGKLLAGRRHQFPTVHHRHRPAQCHVRIDDRVVPCRNRRPGEVAGQFGRKRRHVNAAAGQQQSGHTGLEQRISRQWPAGGAVPDPVACLLHQIAILLRRLSGGVVHRLRGRQCRQPRRRTLRPQDPARSTCRYRKRGVLGGDGILEEARQRGLQAFLGAGHLQNVGLVSKWNSAMGAAASTAPPVSRSTLSIFHKAPHLEPRRVLLWVVPAGPVPSFTVTTGAATTFVVVTVPTSRYASRRS